jgi:pimeloyl-ACP methyl ester carboxylesterase
MRLLALALLLISSVARAEWAVMVPLTIDGEPVRLAVRSYIPPGEGPFPTLIFHHGSTGDGRRPVVFPMPQVPPPRFLDFFRDRGWALVMPSRRGRGGSEGLYDEGFMADRSSYTCEKAVTLAGADRALRDIDAVTAAILDMPFVDRDRIVVGGVSRGGILSVAYAGQRPELVKGVINFVGGWLGTRCASSSSVNPALFKRGATYPKATLWLYASLDGFYPLEHSAQNYAAFVGSGGSGEFRGFTGPDVLVGHGLHTRPDIWGPAVDAYLTQIGLGAR